jgi:acetolactate synthase-1/2/3 large subunit
MTATFPDVYLIRNIGCHCTEIDLGTRLPVTFVLFNNNAHAMGVIREQLFYGDRYSYNRFAPSRLGAGLATMLPGLPSVDVTDADGFSAAMRTAPDVDGPSVVSIECAADEIPPFATFLGPSIAKNIVHQDITKDNRTGRCTRATKSSATTARSMPTSA